MTVLIVVAVLLAWLAIAVAIALIVSRTIRRAEREERVVLEPALNRQPSGLARPRTTLIES